MLVEALELLVGGRADATIVRPGASEARVDGRFVVGDDELVLSRVVPADGRSRAYIDGRPSTVGALAEAAAGLVDLHGQHEHQSLLAGPDAARRARRLRRRRRRAAARGARPPDGARRRAGRARWRGPASGPARSTCCGFQVAELDGAGARRSRRRTRPGGPRGRARRRRRPPRGRRRRPRRAHRRRRGTRRAGGRAVGGDRSGAVRDVADRLAAVLAELDDVAAELRDTAEAIDEDPEQLAAVRGRAGSCCATCAASTATTSARSCATAARRRIASPSSRATTSGPP